MSQEALPKETSPAKGTLLSSLLSLLPRKKIRSKASPEERTSSTAIEAWITQQIAQFLEVDAEQIDPQQPFADFGLDSRTAVTLSGDLERWLDRRLSPTLIWDYPTIEALSKYLASGQDAEPVAS